MILVSTRAQNGDQCTIFMRALIDLSRILRVAQFFERNFYAQSSEMSRMCWATSASLRPLFIAIFRILA